ncbi:hypothetical protein HMPREF1591_05020 [Escherichia coli 113303]|nr:hypothetical protein HMPREF1591_05020 [Escherichia coli 113303]
MSEDHVMNMQIFIGPTATVAAVCLAAYFALRNERKKKALEIRTTQLDRISELVSRASTNLMQYTGTLASILEAHTKENYLPDHKFNINEISKWKNDLDKREDWAIDIQQLRTCQHNLEFHREKEWAEWEKIIPPLLDKINQFFLISKPGQPVTLINGQNKTVDELIAFSIYLQQQTEEIKAVRKLLLSQMREEFIELTSFEPVTIFSLLKSIKKSVLQFFCISALKN